MSTIGVKKIQYPDGPDILTLDSSGSIAIADSATVGGILDVTGDLTIAGDLRKTTAGTSNFCAGVNAGNSIASGGNYNVCVGDEAGTAITTGDNNVAVGFEALKTTVTTSNNIAVGYQALGSHTGSDNVVIMGGCALNCAANTHAYDFFKRVWIMPAPDDAGSAIGAVLAHKKVRIPFTPYLGYKILHQNTNASIVEYLRYHKICGLARGRAEFGPRALGARSLLADPTVHNIKDVVNTIKNRQSFQGR